MASIEHPGAGPLAGVPLREKFRQIPHDPPGMNGPFGGSMLVARAGHNPIRVSYKKGGSGLNMMARSLPLASFQVLTPRPS